MKRKKRGFTIVEMLMVIAVLFCYRDEHDFDFLK